MAITDPVVKLNYKVRLELVHIELKGLLQYVMKDPAMTLERAIEYINNALSTVHAKEMQRQIDSDPLQPKVVVIGTAKVFDNPKNEISDRWYPRD